MDIKHRKERLQYLMEREHQKNNRLITSPLFDECIKALGKQTVIFSSEKSEGIFEEFCAEYKITSYGRIEWSSYDFFEITGEALQNNKILMDSSTQTFVLWSHGKDPVIQTTIKSVIENLDDITAVSSDVWLYQPHLFVIEIFHDGIIRGVYFERTRS